MIADSRRGNEERTVVVGGHLDSVPAGPGINDNGSGTSAILETAEQIAELGQGIPAGGLFTGAEVEKTPEQVAVYGGVAGEQYDPCYHEECDTLDSVFGFPPGLPELDGNGALVLDQMADAVAHATWHFALDRKELGGATQAQRPERLRAYRLPYRGPQRRH